MSIIDRDTLVKEIKDFLDTYAGIRQDYDIEFDEDVDKYTSPDASELHVAMEMIEHGVAIKHPILSQWGSGGYKPYTSEEGRKTHDELIAKIAKYI